MLNLNASCGVHTGVFVLMLGSFCELHVRAVRANPCQKGVSFVCNEGTLSLQIPNRTGEMGYLLAPAVGLFAFGARCHRDTR